MSNHLRDPRNPRMQTGQLGDGELCCEKSSDFANPCCHCNRHNLVWHYTLKHLVRGCTYLHRANRRPKLARAEVCFHFTILIICAIIYLGSLIFSYFIGGACNERYTLDCWNSCQLIRVVAILQDPTLGVC